MSVDFLAIEVFTFSPHLEAGGEICLRQLGDNKKVVHCFIDVENPDDTFIARSIWYKKKYKVKRLHKILRNRNIKVHYLNLNGDNAKSEVEEFASTELASMDVLRTLKYKGAHLGIGVASSFISKAKSSEPDITGENRKLLGTYLKSSAIVYEQSKKLIERIKPKTVLIFNGRLACSKAIWEAAKQIGVATEFHERGATPDRYLLVGTPIHSFKGIRERRDKAWKAAGPDKKALANQFFQRRRNGDGIGWTSFTEKQVKNQFPAQKNTLRFVYFSSSDDEFAAVEDAVEDRAFKSQRHAIRWLIEWVSAKENVELVIRIHPHLSIKAEKEKRWWCSLGGKNVTLLRPEDKTDSYALAESADIVLAYNSTIGVEASYWGVPSIALGDAVYRGLDCVYEPETTEELAALLESGRLATKPRANCLPYGYYALSFGEKYKYFKPNGLFRGWFFGDELSYESPLHQKIRRGVFSMISKLGGKLA